jgi:valyl-tRNA synthetase
MRGKEVFYPVGWDDNGLPTERRVQNYFGVRCDSSLPYDPEFRPAGPAGGLTAAARGQTPVSRRNFVELCRQLTELDERAYAGIWRRAGLSVDWSMAYRTIEDRPTAISQRAFLGSLARGEAYLAEGPALWDVTFGTAVAQAEIEEREVSGAYYRIGFGIEPGPEAAAPGPDPTQPAPAQPAPAGSVLVATTRPELLPACVALVAHPDDERYAALVGTVSRTPVFGVKVPVLAHRLADPAKGTGLAMVCTFGDGADVTWWRELDLETRPVIGRDGRLRAEPPAGITDERGLAAYAQLAGLTAKAARSAITELLRGTGDLRGDPEPVVHAVKFFEKGDAPLEIVASRQWYVKNGGRDAALREALLARGRQLDWHPAHMRTRYEDWVHGLAGDWLISRQRYFGVPIPVWYPLDAEGAPVYDDPLLPADTALPVDPATDVPPGYRQEQRGLPGGFAGDPDVMDTWATSSLTPQIAGGWSTDPDLLSRVFPMDLRPQAHDIIRTWLFYTVLRSQAQHGVLPWRHAAISGWILDPDRKKMSKSKGNVVTPVEVLHDHGTDAVRYWAASARLGVDTAFEPGQLKIGRRLAVKILNASKFVLSAIPPVEPAGGPRAAEPPTGPSESSERPTELLDQAMLARLAGVAGKCTAAFEGFDHALALATTEHFFWFFCDDFVELVKPRAYGERGPAAARSAALALRLALSAVLRLFAPFLPFVTEEVWSWWQDGSIHRAPWPDPAALRGAAAPADDRVLDAASAAIASVRKAKSAARLPMRATVQKLVVTAPAAELDALAAALPDLRAAGRVDEVELRPAAGAPAQHQVTL